MEREKQEWRGRLEWWEGELLFLFLLPHFHCHHANCSPISSDLNYFSDFVIFVSVLSCIFHPLCRYLADWGPKAFLWSWHWLTRKPPKSFLLSIKLHNQACSCISKLASTCFGSFLSELPFTCQRLLSILLHSSLSLLYLSSPFVFSLNLYKSHLPRSVSNVIFSIKLSKVMSFRS